MSFNSQTFAEITNGSAAANEPRHAVISEKQRLHDSRQAVRLEVALAIAKAYKQQNEYNKIVERQQTIAMPEQLAQPDIGLQESSPTEPEQVINTEPKA